MGYPSVPSLTATWLRSIDEVPEAVWDELAQPLETPFLEWSWLHNMERSGSVGANAGWLPCHLALWQGSTLVGAAPMYLKGHSRGEFVFDHQWADLAERLGVEYYPKLLGMSPFTPAEGYRFLIAPDADEAMITRAMVEVIDGFCDRNHISGCHFLYVDPQWRATMTQLGYSEWLHHSYVWQNHGFNDFDDYLGMFNANQRRNIKRERKSMATAGLRLEAIAGDAISKTLCDQMYDFYTDTCDKFGWWGSKYLSRKFFHLLHHDYRHRMVFFAAYSEDASNDNSDPVGMSFCLTKGDRLYGRYWGSAMEMDNLHFNACYYAPIEWAIANNITLFDPGAGGRHKKRRGFPALGNYSLHRFYTPRMKTLLTRYITEVNELEQQEIDAINAELPLKLLPGDSPGPEAQG